MTTPEPHVSKIRPITRIPAVAEVRKVTPYEETRIPEAGLVVWCLSREPGAATLLSDGAVDLSSGNGWVVRAATNDEMEADRG